MPAEPILLKALLRSRHLQSHRTFCREYDRAAREVDPSLVGRHPSRAQFFRWQSGELLGLPYPDHCRVLEAMFPEHSAAELFAPCPNGAPVRPAASGPFLDLTAVFATRSEFVDSVTPRELLDGARDVRAAGLSLNVICRQYPAQRLRGLLEDGTRVRCLFLAPDGDAIRAREREEGHAPGMLSALTELNIQILQRLRTGLSAPGQERFELRSYDEVPRLNLLLVDDRTCVVQPYLPQAQGVDSPTMLITRDPAHAGLYITFDQVFTSIWDRGMPL